MKFLQTPLDALTTTCQTGRNRLQDHLEPVWAWFRQQSPNDQRMITLLAVFLFLVLGYLLVLAPSWNYLQQQKLQLAEKQRLVARIQENEALLRAHARNSAGKNKGVQGGSHSINELVAAVATRKKLSLKRLEREGEQGVRVVLESVPFDQVVLWLDTLEQDYGILLTNISVDARKQSGLVDVRASFQR